MPFLGIPKLSTMVVLYSLPMKLHTNKLVELMPVDDIVIKVEKKGYLKRGESKRDRIKRRQPQANTTSGFGHNSITLVMFNDAFGTRLKKEVTIKIFHNGVFHLTGIPHEDYERSSIANMMAIMKALPDECYIIKPEEWTEPVRRVVLMNFTTSFDSQYTVSRLGIQSHFQAKGIRADFEPDVDPAVKIRFAEKWTARIFRTGKINLTALKTQDECDEFVRQLEVHFGEYFTSGHRSSSTLQA